MVANLAHRLLSFEEYLTYDDNTDNRYELVDGVLVAMTPPLISHFDIAKFIERCFDQEMQRLNLPWLCRRRSAGILDRGPPRKQGLDSIAGRGII